MLENVLFNLDQSYRSSKGSFGSIFKTFKYRKFEQIVSALEYNSPRVPVASMTVKLGRQQNISTNWYWVNWVQFTIYSSFSSTLSMIASTKEVGSTWVLEMSTLSKFFIVLYISGLNGPYTALMLTSRKSPLILVKKGWFYLKSKTFSMQ